jgi:hypothetical protein
MINFNCIDRIEIDDIKNIIKEKNNSVKKTKLKEIQKKITDRYALYISVESQGRLITDIFDDEEISALKSLYSSKTKTAKEITEGILNNLNPNHSGVCLFCGIGEIDQIDHFFPQEHFPEFAILHKNLIPICGKCNEIKSDKIPGKDDINFLHLIYDVLPIDHYLEFSINYEHTIPKVEVKTTNKYKKNINNTHFESLKLQKRIEKKAVQYFLQIKALKNEFGKKYAQEELDRDYNKHQHFYNVFFWKTELILKMKETDFVNNVS